MIRYLKSTRDGWIFEWDPILAKRADLVEISEQEVFPERFIPVKQVEVVKKTRKGKNLKFVEEAQSELPLEEPELNFSEELSNEAAKGWPK